MGTKANPGEYDCYAHAERDEPMFTLLARDPAAPETIRLWVAARMARGDTGLAKLREALECAAAMEKWRSERLKPGEK